MDTKEESRKHKRLYLGVFFNGDYKYYIPLSSYKKEKYDNMYESLSLKKVKNMAVLLINNMIPAADSVVKRVDFKNEPDEKYRMLLQNEYRAIKVKEKEIRKDARILYFYRQNENNAEKELYKICCDFSLLEEKALEYEE